ncbi:invasin domain 3-containing protein [Rhodohalobacter barkolensis]|uniref:Big-1 domain-containing protein n=1 Tax=Rhodohalobacter barkolensis TaxID=2053187 RepID=A0A2N0VGH4_9BACT|nr:invasin domain 3-containing protein [Rhodohalobacter barkolensis]PKD43291.1 hypothetical protein CWD77_11800 [Rhodohalobacter barkolensis]
MRRFLYAIVIIVAILMFSCDTSTAPFDDTLPDEFTLTTTASPENGGTVQPANGEFVDGARIELQAIENEGYLFDEWQGDLTGSNNPTVLFIRRDLNITALFSEIQFQLNTNVIGEGTITQEIIGEETIKEAEQQQSPDASVESEREIDTDRDDTKLRESLSGALKRQQSDDEQISQDRNSSQLESLERIQLNSQLSASQVIANYRLTAVPEDGWVFDRWEGDLTGNENPVDIVVDEDKEVTAVFVQDDFEGFTLQLDILGNGTVDIDPEKESYEENEEVTLTATPSAGWEFIRWEGDLSGNNNPATILMDANKVISSIFEEEGSPEIAVQTQPSETVAGNPINPAPSIELLDGNGEPLSGVNVSVSLNKSSFATGSTTQSSTNQNGIAVFDDLVIQNADSGYRLTFSADIDGVSDLQSSLFDIIAAAGDPGNTSATVPDGVAGELTVIEITIRDAFGNSVEGATSELSLEVISGDNTGASFETISDEGNGIYTTSYTPTSSGSDIIEILLDGTEIAKSPFTSNVITSSVSSANSSASVDPEELRAGETSVLTITLRDNQDNEVSGIEDDIQISGLGNATAGPITEDGTTGIYSTSISSTTAETITLTIVADAVTLSENPEITFLAGNADEIAIQSGNNQTGTVTQPLNNPFTVLVTDEFGNPVAGQNVSFEITDTPPAAIGQSLSTESAVTNSDGQASSVLTLGSTPGTYEVTTSAGTAGDVIFNATAELGLVSALSILLQPSETEAGTVISPALQVEVTDEGGNPIEGVEVTVAEQGGYSFDSGTLTKVSNSNGIAEFDDLVIQTSGNYTLVFSTVESDVDDVLSDPFDITAAAGDPLNTAVNVPDGAAGEPTTVTINVQDSFGNSVSGAEADLSVLVNGANSANPAVTATGTTGEYTASYTPENAGTDEISVELQGTPVAGSPFESVVTVSDISASVSTVSVNPDELVVGNSSAVTVELRDGSNNAISGLGDSDFDISVSGSASAGTVSETTSGTYLFNVSNTTAQQVTVTVSAQGVTLDDTPAIAFLTGTPDQITITSQPDQTVAGEPVAGSPSILLRDSFDNPVPGIEVTITEQGGQDFTGGDLTVTTDQSGIAAFDNAVISEAGRYNLVFTAEEGLVITSNAFDVVPAAADPSSTTASVPNGAAGDVTNITITVSDEFGNRVNSESDNLTVSVSGDNAGAAVNAITDEGNGEYTTGYTPESNGTDQINIELSGTAISGSPYTSNVITSDADNVAVTAQPQQTVAGQVIGGQPSVLVEDNLGNPVDDVEVVVTLQDGTFASGTTSVSTDASGTAEFNDLTVNESGNYTLEFNAIGVTENAVSDPFDVVPAAASSITTVSGNSQSDVVTETLGEPFVIRVTDTFGNPVQGETIEFDITNTPAGSTGETLSQTTVQTDASGEATSVLTLGTIAGTYSVSAALSGVGSVSFTAGAEAGPADSFEFNTITSPQTAGQAFSITITALDEFDNRAESYSGTATLSTTAGSVNPASASFTDGQATLDVSVSEAGPGQTITAADGAVTGTSNTFDVQSGGVDPDNSAVSADPTNLQAGNPSTVTIDLRDGSNNPVSGLADTDFTIGLTGSATAGTVTEGTAGSYNVDIGNETAETISVTVTANGVTLTDSPSITYTAADAADLAIVSGNNQTGTVSEALADPFVVVITDQFGNPVEGETVDFVIDQTPSGASGQSLSTTSATTDASGEASSTLTLGDTPGTYTTNVSSGSLTPVSFTAEAQIGDASQMAVTTQPSETTAGEVISPAPSVEVTDDIGNPVAGVNVTVSEQGGYTFDEGTTTVSTNSSGIASFDDLVIRTAGSYTLNFSSDASGVDDVISDPFNVTAAAANLANTVAVVPDGVAGNSTEITITLEDEFNNPVSGAASQLTVNVSGANTASPSVSETGTTGEYTSSYTPTNTGADDIAITLNGSTIPGSPFTSNVTTSDISASVSTVTASPSALQVGSNSTVTIELRDGSNNPIGGLTNSDFTISESGDAVSGEVSEISTGTYQFTVQNETAETVAVTVAAGGVTLDDTPEIVFEAGDVDIVAIQTQPGETVAGEPITGPPLVRLLDEFNNRVPGVEITVSEQSGQSFASGTLTITSNSTGQAAFSDLVINEAGNYDLVFTASGQVGSTVAFDVIPAAPLASETTANVPNGAAGDRTAITITVEDEFGNRVGGVAGDLAVSVSGANDGATVDPISDDGNGIYTTGYTPTSTGTDEIAITLDGTAIAGSPYTSEVVTSDAESVAVDTQPQQTVAGQSIAGPPAALVTDNLANPVSGVEVIAGLQSGNFDSGTTSVDSDGSGVATFSDLVVNTAGTYIMEFNAVGVTEDAVTQEFDVIPAAASQTVSVSGDNQTGTVAAELAEPFVVRVEDTFGNPVSGHTVDFSIDQVPTGATGQSLSAASVTTDALGEASSLLTLGTILGDYTVNADAGSAGLIVFTANAEAGPADSFEFNTITSPQTAGQAFSITITALDEFDNRAESYSGTAALSTTAGSINPASASFTDGQATLDVSVSEVGSGQTITATDGALTGTSNTFDVQSGGVDPDNSAVSADPTNLQAGNPSTVTIDLRDGSNNPVSGLTDTDFTIGLTGSATAGTVTEGTAGSYNVDIGNETAETISVTVTANGVTLTDSPSITYTAADAADLVILTGNNQTGTVSEALANPFVVQITDQFGNPVEGETVDFAIDQTPSGASGQSLSTTSATTDASGEASSTLTLGDTPGTYTTNVSSGSLTAVSFTAEAQIGDASQMAVTTQPSETTAGEVISPAPSVEVTDDVGNGVQGISVSVSEQSGEGFDSGTLTQQTDASGVASFPDLIFNTAQNYTLIFNASATGVSNVSSNPFDVISATGDPLSTTADVPNGAAGEATDITISVQDEFNNGVTGAASDLSVSVTNGPNSGAAFASITDNADGTYSTSYTPETIGTDEISITLGTVDISGSPYSSNVTTSDVSASNSTVNAVPETLQAGTNSEVTVELRDGSNNPISGLSSSDFNISVSGNGTSNGFTETSTNGTYSFNVTNTTAEDVTVTVTATGTTLNQAPQITFTAADPDLMVITTEPGQSVAGQPIEGPPAVRITDEYNNPVPAFNVDVTEQGGATFTGGSTTSVNTNDSGLAIFDNVAIETAGQYNLVFAATGVTNRTSNAFDVTAAAGDPSSTTATVPDGTAGQETIITIDVTDEFGNEVSGAATDLSVSVSGANTATPVVSETGPPGEYTASYTPVITGTDIVAITLGGADISGGPYSSDVSAGAATSYSFDTITTPQTAGAPFEITITALDGSSNTATGYNGTANLTTTAGTITPGTAEFTNGVATLNVEVTDAGTGQTITADDGTISATSNTFDVDPGPVSSTVSSAGATSPHTADGSDFSTVTVTLADASGNGISGLGDADFAVNVGSNAAAGTVSETTTDGTYEFTVTNNTVETVTVVITADGVTLDDQPEIQFQ